ncbi:MAG: ATP-binding protein [Clostridiales bacterium]|nr:ATP-binding protein [Candidatus Cacconaster stercorequi]
MPYDGKIMRRALTRFDADKQRRAQQFLQRQRKVFAEEPELLQIEQELRSTMSQIISSALQRGTDPLPAIRVIRDRNLDLQQRRAELLKSRGYPADYLEEKPRCSFCGDTGYRKGTVCSCLQSYYAREQILELSQLLDIGTQSFETFELDWYSDERGGRRYSPRETARHNFEVCRRYAEEFGTRSGNLLLFGAPGLGKTFLSACIARVVSEDGFSVVYDTAGHIFSQMEAAKFRRDEDETVEGDVSRYMNCDLLIMDDLGTEMVTTFVQSALYQVVNGRLLSGKKTIINTNLSPDEIGCRYSPQVLSRIEGEYEILPFIGEDIRRLKREQH